LASFTPTNAFLAALDNGGVDLGGGVFYGQLMTAAFSFDRRANNTMATVTGEITPVSGYSAGGQAVTVAISQNTTTHVSTVTFQPATWSATVSGVRGMLIYARPSGVPANQLVVGYADFGGAQASVGGTFRVAGAGFTCTKTGSGSITIPDSAVDKILRHQITPDSDTIYAMVLGPGYTPNVAHAWRSDVASYEVSGTGYVAGGVQVGVTVARDDATDSCLTQFEGVILPSCTISARFVAYYKRLGGAASADPLLMVVDWGGTYASSAAVFPIGSNAYSRAAVIG
jgi:hypothetical protein